jgi:signal transduction histidine kinase
VMLAGNLWGAVIISSDDQAFPPEAEFRVGDFADLAAQAIANAHAREELAASRMRIVEASDAERRRLERNLHDGAQQRLVATSLAVRLAARRVNDDPAVRAMLDGAGDELAQALEELRELARGLHPAVLTDHGLRAAIEAVADRTPLPVEVDVPFDDRLPERVEAAAYFVICEALTNVAKYAQASEVRVRVGRSDGVAQVEVADDGVGGADASGGSGLRGLADRVEALGGRLAVTSPEGEGTTVRAQLPVA